MQPLHCWNSGFTHIVASWQMLVARRDQITDTLTAFQHAELIQNLTSSVSLRQTAFCRCGGCQVHLDVKLLLVKAGCVSRIQNQSLRLSNRSDAHSVALCSGKRSFQVSGEMIVPLGHFHLRPCPGPRPPRGSCPWPGCWDRACRCLLVPCH